MSIHLAPIDRRPPQRTTSRARAWRDLASRAAHPSARPLGTDDLTAIAEGLATATVPFERRVEVPLRRHHELILATPVYEAWVICWPQGGRLELHDHGPSAGSFCVVGGNLHETLVVDGCLHTRRLAVGQSATFGPRYLHDVVNRHPVPATSVHVYSPPLSAMTFYRQTVTGELVPTRTQLYDRPGTPPHHVARVKDAFLGDGAHPTSPIEVGRNPADATKPRMTSRQGGGNGIPWTMLKPGDKTPAVALSDQHGETVKLSGFKGRKVLVYFYPKADTPGCTAQSCGLRDIAGQIGDTQIVGISPDSPSRQKKFDEKYSLGFPLLADEDHAVAEAFEVWKEKKNYGRTYMGIERSAFLIDEKGKVAKAWYKISPKDTPAKLLEALAE